MAKKPKKTRDVRDERRREQVRIAREAYANRPRCVRYDRRTQCNRDEGHPGNHVFRNSDGQVWERTQTEMTGSRGDMLIFDDVYDVRPEIRRAVGEVTLAFREPREHRQLGVDFGDDRPVSSYARRVHIPRGMMLVSLDGRMYRVTQDLSMQDPGLIVATLPMEAVAPGAVGNISVFAGEDRMRIAPGAPTDVHMLLEVRRAVAQGGADTLVPLTPPSEHPSCRCVVGSALYEKNGHTCFYMNPEARWYHYDAAREEIHEMDAEHWQNLPVKTRVKKLTRVWRLPPDAMLTCRVAGMGMRGHATCSGLVHRRGDCFLGYPGRGVAIGAKNAPCDPGNHRLADMWNKLVDTIWSQASGRAMAMPASFPLDFPRNHWMTFRRRINNPDDTWSAKMTTTDRPDQFSHWEKDNWFTPVTMDLLGYNLGIVGVLDWALGDAVSRRVSGEDPNADYRDSAMIMLDQWKNLDDKKAADIIKDFMIRLAA